MAIAKTTPIFGYIVGLLDAAAVTSATVGGCREVSRAVRAVDTVVAAVSAAIPHSI